MQDDEGNYLKLPTNSVMNSIIKIELMNTFENLFDF